MKKILIIVAIALGFDFVVIVGVLILSWHSLMHGASGVLVRGGDRLVATHQYAAAIGQYDAAIRLDPQNAVAYAGRAYAHVYLGQLDTALADGDKAVEIDGRSGVAYGARGWAREWKADWTGAHADYDKAIEYDPKIAAFYAHRGWVRFRQKENDGAIKDFDEALRLAPKMAFAYHDRATVRFMQDDLPGALEDEDSAIEFSPRDAVYYERRADFRLRSNDPDGAMDDAEAALGLQPLAPQALYEKGVALRRQGKAADSVATLDQLLQLNPRYPGALFERAMAKYVKGDFSGTEADLKANRVHTIERPYTELWLWIVATEQGKADADRELEAYLTDARNLAPDTWQEKLGDMVLGRTTPDVLAASLEIGPNNRENREHRCELWFLAGKMALVHGDKATAKVDFQKAVATHTADTVEFCEAQRDLTKL